MPIFAPDRPKSKFFGSFLEAVSNDSPPPAQTAASPTGAAVPAGLQDLAILRLARSNGGLSVGALFEPPFASFGQLSSVLRELEGFRLITLSDGMARLTEDGLAVARKLGA